jgi:hypothetical protein
MYDMKGPPEQNYTKRTTITLHYNKKKEIKREHERIGTSYKMTKSSAGRNRWSRRRNNRANKGNEDIILRSYIAKYVYLFFHSFCKHRMQDIHNFSSVHLKGT